MNHYDDYRYEDMTKNDFPVEEVNLTEENDTTTRSTMKHGTRVAGLHDAIRYIEIRNEVFNDIRGFSCTYNPHDQSWNLEVETDG